MRIPDNAVRDTILLRGREVPVFACELPHATLKFYPENPRIYSEVWQSEDDPPTQEVIFHVLAKADHVRDGLVPSIRLNGGLIEPILVRDNIVLEGNSRLAAYRVLTHQDGGTKWLNIRARVLPSDVSESEVFSLLGEYHMVGKKDWLPFEQAGYLFRRFKHHGIEPEALALEVGLTKARVVHLVRVYDYMLANNERVAAKWSYYDELLKSRAFAEAAKTYPEFLKVVTEKIKDGDIARAVDLRDQLPLIVKAGGKTLRRFVEGKFCFADAVDDAKRRGAGNYHAKKLKDFRTWASDATAEEFAAMSEDELSNIRYELNKIQTRIGQLIRYATKKP